MQTTQAGGQTQLSYKGHKFTARDVESFLIDCGGYALNDFEDLSPREAFEIIAESPEMLEDFIGYAC